jgi:uncharacterized protein
MNRVRLADVPPQAWRNGGGSTQPLLAWPSAEDWLLRVSVAAIEQDGGFSAFDGYERWFAVVEGAGVALSLPQGDVMQRADDEPLCFDGADAPHCRLLAGPTQDLNLMLRQDRGSGRMRRATGGSQACRSAGWRGLYAADAMTLELDGALMPVAAGTLLWQDGPQAVGWQMQAGAGRAWWMSWSPR